MGLQAAWALGFMALALGYSFMPLLVKLAYQRGSLLADDVAAITAVARVMVLCLPAYAILQLSAAALNAAKRPQTVMINAFMSIGLSVAGYLLLKLAFSTPLAAPWGFVIFHIIAAYLNFRALGFSASGKSSLTNTMIKTTLRIGLGIAPFA
ncbi:MAG: hypothetical protein GY942_10525, partial [Aestuariibacter sp.]|nr:hypothetical protein [Aestuariibacter sp.]